MVENPIAPPVAALPYVEFVTMVAALMALNAMAIDIILPALQQMGENLGVADENARQLPLTAYIVTFGISQLFYGPVSDRFGRRPVLLFGLADHPAALREGGVRRRRGHHPRDVPGRRAANRPRRKGRRGSGCIASAPARSALKRPIKRVSR